MTEIRMRTFRELIAVGVGPALPGLLLLLLLALVGCSPGGERPGEEGKAPPPKQEDYPKLESRLFQLATAEDPIEFAKRQGLDYAVVVRVLVELESPDSSVPDGICVENRFEEEVEALVPLERLLTLAQEPQVKVIRTLPLILPDSK
jgi:hypothetical protein